MTRAVFLFAPIMIGLASYAQAQATADEFCAQVEPLAAQPACRQDFFRGAQLVIQYTRMNGLSDEEGPKLFAMFGSVFSWQNLISKDKTPAWIIGHCDEEDSQTGWLDFRKVWACIAENDPNAALLEAI